MGGSDTKKKESNSWHNFAAGATAGFVSRLIISPLDVLKIRFQVQSAATPEYSGILQATRTILQNEGVFAFWKGLSAAQCMVVPFFAVSFWTYSSVGGWLERQQSTSKTVNSLVAGSAAGIAGVISTYPLDLLRTRLAVQRNTAVYNGLPHAISTIYAKHGIPGFYRGLSPALISIAPYSSAQFILYDAFKLLFTNLELAVHKWQHKAAVPDSLSTFGLLGAGFCSGLTAKLLTYVLFWC